jgi:hypothetical protein
MKYLLVAAWPVGLALILGAGYLLARRPAAMATGPRPGSHGGGLHGGRSHGGGRRVLAGGGIGEWPLEAAKMIVLVFAGAVVVYGVMALLGLLVVNHGLAIDRPAYTWMTHNWVHSMVALQNRLTKIGNTWTVWGAAVAAAVCLSVTWRTRRWLPPIVFTVCIFVDHYTTLALRHTFHRLGPPDSPLGTYPSGGCDRVILFGGLIAYLLWREFSGQRRTAFWSGAVVAALGFNEAYSRFYLTLHWLTDALSGLLYGALLLAVFIAAVRLVAGPAARRPALNDAPVRSSRSSEAPESVA